MKNRIAVIAAALAIALPALAGPAGAPAPPFTLSARGGRDVSLTQYHGRVVMINFWASWCGPCRRNNPRLVKLYNKYHTSGFEIYGVSLDEETDSWKAAVHHDKLEWIQVIDDKGWQAESASLYGVDMIPSSFLIDRNGVIRYINQEGSDLEKSVKILMKD